MAQWILYLDESGPFEEGAACSLVGGALIDVSSVVLDVVALKRALTACYPYFPWPLHATDTRRPMAHVAGSMLLGVSAEVLEAPLGRARQLVEAADAGPLRDLREAVSAGRMPAQEVLERALDEVTKLDPALAGLLRSYPLDRMRASNDLFAALARVLRGRVFAVGAAVGAGVSYPDAMVLCIHRALQVIRRRAAPQPGLRLTVASRGKADGTETTPDDLQRWAAEGARIAELPGEVPQPDVEISIDLPKAMRSETSPWLVVADFICNRLVLPVSRARNWWWLTRSTATNLKLPVSVPVEWVSATLPGLTYRAGADGVDPGWGAEQARMWTRSVRRPP